MEAFVDGGLMIGLGFYSTYKLIQIINQQKEVDGYSTSLSRNIKVDDLFYDQKKDKGLDGFFKNWSQVSSAIQNDKYASEFRKENHISAKEILMGRLEAYSAFKIEQKGNVHIYKMAIQGSLVNDSTKNFLRYKSLFNGSNTLLYVEDEISIGKKGGERSNSFRLGSYFLRGSTPNNKVPVFGVDQDILRPLRQSMKNKETSKLIKYLGGFFGSYVGLNSVKIDISDSKIITGVKNGVDICFIADLRYHELTGKLALFNVGWISTSTKELRNRLQNANFSLNMKKVMYSVILGVCIIEVVLRVPSYYESLQWFYYQYIKGLSIMPSQNSNQNNRRRRRGQR